MIWPTLAVIIAGILLLAMFVLELALRMDRFEEQLDDADVEEHAHPHGNIEILDHHR